LEEEGIKEIEEDLDLKQISKSLIMIAKQLYNAKLNLPLKMTEEIKEIKDIKLN